MASKSKNPPDYIKPWVEAFGEEDAIQVFLSMGGVTVYLPKKSTDANQLARIVGKEKVDALGQRLGSGYFKVPISNQWIAECLWEQGRTNAEIARILRVDEATVRRWFNTTDAQS